MLPEMTYVAIILCAIGLSTALIWRLLSPILRQLKPQEMLLNQCHEQIQRLQQQLAQARSEHEKQQLTQQFAMEKLFQQFKEMIISENTQSREQHNQQQLNSLSVIQEGLQKTAASIQQQLLDNLSHHTRALNERMHTITQDIQQRLQTISQQVEKRLNDGFEKTTETFTRIVERLAVIDAAQKKITELSTNVVSLQELLSDKRSRGAFGEVQLSALIHNVLPESNFALQHTLSNGKRVDCMLFLPSPTGNVAIDAKFPLENFQMMMDHALPDIDRKAAEQRFKIDMRKHIQDIADKYIIEGETADGAVMFIPAEAIFAEIHAHYPDIIEIAQKARVWLASPTTVMAILTTARAVLKDAATRKQVHIIQEHLRMLAIDFARFEKRMDALAKHIEQAHTDVNEVQTSAGKITSRFNKIEQVELGSAEEIKSLADS
ncbi:MAG: DNA recombination protein RmuC [Gammaproteobacteria bacterium]